MFDVQKQMEDLRFTMADNNFKRNNWGAVAFSGLYISDSKGV